MRSYATKPKKVCEISLRFQPPNITTTHFPSFKTITRFPFYFPFFSQLPRLINFFLFKKLVRISIFKIELKIMFRGRKNFQWSESPFKKNEKEMKVDPKLGGQWNVLSLVAHGRKRRSFQCLKANGRRRRSFQFTFSHFPPKQLYLGPRLFPLISRFCFTIVLGHVLCVLSFFPWPINYDRTFRCHKCPTPSLSIRFARRSFFFCLKLWRHIWPHLTGLKLCKWMKSLPHNHI
jgi:hypothetical protein